MSLFHNLNPAQQEAVRTIEGPVLVLAGAGSGKTRTLTYRIAHLIKEGVHPGNILAVTFTNKAANEMLERMKNLLKNQQSKVEVPYASLLTREAVSICTFHSLCARILREYGTLLGYRRNFTIFDTDDQIKALKEVMSQLQLSTKELSPYRVLSLIERAKRELVSVEQFVEVYNDITGHIRDSLYLIYAHYQDFLKRHNAMDFDDLLYNTVILWQNHKDVLRAFQNKWQYVHVDEYQDTNYAQSELCRLLADLHQNLFVVGDDCQSIYSFRGANIQNILEFTNKFKNVRTILLEQNYRSTQNILTTANALIKKNHSQQAKKLWTENDKGMIPRVITVDNEEREAEFIVETIAGYLYDKEDTQVLEYEYEDNLEEMGVLDRIMALNKKKPREIRKNRIILDELTALNKFVVLYRTNAQSRALEEVFLQYNIPYRIVGGTRFYDRKEVKDILAFLKILGNPYDLISLSRIIPIGGEGIGKQGEAQFKKYIQEKGGNIFVAVHALLSEKPSCFSSLLYHKLLNFAKFLGDFEKAIETSTVSELIDFTILRASYKEFLMERDEKNFEERLENVNELKTVAQKEDKLGTEGLLYFLESVSLMTDIDLYDESHNYLTLMTLHAVKGLEFDTVFITGMEQGLFPHLSLAIEQGELEEERRLCYVGITRAKRALYLIHALERTLYGTTAQREPSEFIRDLKGTVENVKL